MKYVPKFQQGKPILNADLYTYPSAYLYDYFRSPKHKERVRNRIIEDYGGFPSLSQDKEFVNKRVNIGDILYKTKTLPTVDISTLIKSKQAGENIRKVSKNGAN